MTERNAGAARPHDSAEESDCKEPNDSIERDPTSPVARLENAEKQLLYARDKLEAGTWADLAICELVADTESVRHRLETVDGVDRGDGIETDGGRISTEDLTDEQIERVLNSKGFQKMLAYSKLADGIEVLESEDEIFDSMVNTITKQHSSVGTESSVREVLTLFQSEVSTFTEPLVDEDGEGMDSDDLEDIYVKEGSR